MDLATVRPTQPDPVWAAVATGMYPAKNGVRRPRLATSVRGGDAAARCCCPITASRTRWCTSGCCGASRNSSALVQAGRCGSILGDAGIAVGVVRWPLTYPAQPVRGFVVSDRVHELLGSMLEFDDRGRVSARGDAASRARRRRAGRGGQLAAAAVAGCTPEASAAIRDEFYGRAMRELHARVAGAVHRAALPGHRHRRPLLPALHAAARVRRRRARTSPPPARCRCSIATTATSTNEIGDALGGAGARRPAARGLRLRHAARRTPSSTSSRGCSATR